MKNPYARRLQQGLVAAAVWAASVGALAAISSGANDPGNVAGERSEFFLVIWDEAHGASYTLDLGLPVQTLLTQGQSDAGFQRFWTLDGTTDSRLKSLLDLGAASTSLLWGVFAIDAIGTVFEPGTLNLYTTLRHDTPTGTVNPYYTQLNQLTYSAWGGYTETALADQFLGLLNSWQSPNSTHAPGVTEADFLRNGSSFSRDGEPGYWGTQAANAYVYAYMGPMNVPNLNPVGRSSWAYRITSDANGAADPFTFAPMVSEFENLTHDAYWGLAVNPADGTLALSYTLEAVAPSATAMAFARSIGRTETDGGFVTRRLEGAAASNSETAASFGNRVLLGSAEAEFGLTASAVPEPATWALWATGLAGVGALARRRQRRAQA
jgi:hypothetical protein